MAKRKGGQPHNQNARAHGFYSGKFTEDELQLVAAFVTDPSVDDEIWMQRVLNSRLLQASQEADTDTLIRIFHALTVGTGRVAKLLRDKRALSGEAANNLVDLLIQAGQEVLTEVGIIR